MDAPAKLALPASPMLAQIVCVRRPAVSLAITRLRTKAAMAGMLLARPEGEATARQ
jgi:hypothetical protein